MKMPPFYVGPCPPLRIRFFRRDLRDEPDAKLSPAPQFRFRRLGKARFRSPRPEDEIGVGGDKVVDHAIKERSVCRKEDTIPSMPGMAIPNRVAPSWIK